MWFEPSQHGLVPLVRPLACGFLQELGCGFAPGSARLHAEPVLLPALVLQLVVVLLRLALIRGPGALHEGLQLALDRRELDPVVRRVLALVEGHTSPLPQLPIQHQRVLPHVVAERLDAPRDARPDQLAHDLGVVTTQDGKHQVDRLAAMELRVLDRSVIGDLRSLGHRTDRGLPFVQHRPGGRVGPCQVLPRLREDVEGNMPVLRPPLDLDAGPAAGSVAQLLALLVTPGVLPASPATDSECPALG